jgi:hypothetical protein
LDKPEEKRQLGRIMANKAEVKIPLGRPRNRCKDNIKMYLERKNGVV